MTGRCADCRDPLKGVWRENEHGAIVKCPECFPVAPTSTPEQERDAALAATAAANPGAYEAALRIVRETALAEPVFSSNQTLHRMEHADIPGPVVGAAFREAAKQRWIKRVRWVPSEKQGTKSHHVGEYESLIFRGRAAHRQETA